MAWFTRFTRFGDMHLVYGQEANMSCGIASVMMCVFKMNKLKPGSTAVTMEKQITKKYETLLGSSYNSELTGTYPQHLATILGSFTKPSWGWIKGQPSDVPQTLIDKVGVSSAFGPSVDVSPVILGVDWDGGGAHWIVVDTIRDVLGTKYATVCDPWDANVHLQKFKVGDPFYYDAGSGGFMINLIGGTKGDKKPYGNSAKGQVKTWGMICPT